MTGGSQRSIIELVRTRLFKSLYFDSLVELWTRYIETELADYPEKAELFKAYLEDIIDAVEWNNNNINLTKWKKKEESGQYLLRDQSILKI